MTQGKDLRDMTLEELWELFPVILTPHDVRWEQWAEEEIAALSGILSAHSPVINHIGSTAVPAILAKPIVDILVELPPDFDRSQVRAVMEGSGYICMAESATRLSFNKGYTPAGFAEKVFHIHVHPLGDNDELLFRDYLRNNPATAREYETLKSSLLPRYRHDRDGYTEAKSEFVKKVLRLARQRMAANGI